MIKYILMLVIFFNATIFAAVENSADQQEFSLQSVIHRAKSTEFNKESPEVGAVYLYFNGQNILSARDIQYARWFHEGQCSIETLYALYLALQEFLSSDGQGFITKELNDGFSPQNYDFLKKIFGESE